MLTTASSDLDGIARSMRDHGASRSDFERHEAQHGFLLADFDVLGYNYRLTDSRERSAARNSTAPTGSSPRRRQLARTLRRAPKRRRMAADTPHSPGNVHGYQAYVCLFCPEEPTLA